MWVEVLKTKDQTLDCFKKIKLRAEVESGEWMKDLTTDRGGECQTRDSGTAHGHGIF